MESRAKPLLNESVATACIFLFVKLRDWNVLLNFAKKKGLDYDNIS